MSEYVMNENEGLGGVKGLISDFLYICILYMGPIFFIFILMQVIFGDLGSNVINVIVILLLILAHSMRVKELEKIIETGGKLDKTPKNIYEVLHYRLGMNKIRASILVISSFMLFVVPSFMLIDMLLETGYYGVFYCWLFK